MGYPPSSWATFRMLSDSIPPSSASLMAVRSTRCRLSGTRRLVLDRGLTDIGIPLGTWVLTYVRCTSNVRRIGDVRRTLAGDHHEGNRSTNLWLPVYLALPDSDQPHTRHT